MSGHARGRPALGAVAIAKAKAKAQPKAAAAPPPAQPAPPDLAAAPVGRAPALHADVMDAATWWAYRRPRRHVEVSIQKKTATKNVVPPFASFKVGPAARDCVAPSWVA